ncbi:MAG TPA: molybdopterin-binding protein [Nitriliruptorales bacterium]|nr:molybdopterin-binding protein [Nitriliruptorales bacterium]
MCASDAADGPLEASILVIGDEILGGFVQDTNSGWLASRLVSHGVDLSQIVVVPDDVAAIDEALQRELSRPRPRIVFTTGGIGSTPDDVTYEAVARSLGRDLEVAPELARRIDGALAWTRAQGLEVDDEFADHMMRMARIPAGGCLLRRDGSWAPGVRVDVEGGIDATGGASIVILPGVPSQLRAIVTSVVEPEMLAGRGRSQAVAEVTHGFPESALNRCFARLAERYPDVQVGSYPGVPMLVRLRGEPDRVATARADVEEFLRQLEAEPGGARLRQAWARRLAGDEERP